MCMCVLGGGQVGVDERCVSCGTPYPTTEERCKTEDESPSNFASSRVSLPLIPVTRITLLPAMPLIVGLGFSLGWRPSSPSSPGMPRVVWLVSADACAPWQTKMY